ncbi:MAG: DUF4433 domain-containing protein [Abitibacteriaceae bacterium]|nr:DUF4433 domain-containing protein [Abditibacteriaceae bacterium]
MHGFRALTGQTKIPDEVRLYRVTHLSNLASIAQEGLLPFNLLQQRCIEHRSIAFQHLQERRHKITTPLGGTLHDCVPWSFAARPPMLYTVARGGLADSVRQEDIVHLVTSVGRVQQANLPFVFTDGHPLSDFSVFSTDIDKLPHVLDWEVLKSLHWHNTEDDPDRKRRRQAEFLIQSIVPWRIVAGIAVRTEATKQSVETALVQTDYRPKVLVLPEWYYDL